MTFLARLTPSTAITFTTSQGLIPSPEQAPRLNVLCRVTLSHLQETLGSSNKPRSHSELLSLLKEQNRVTFRYVRSISKVLGQLAKAGYMMANHTGSDKHLFYTLTELGRGYRG